MVCVDYGAIDLKLKNILPSSKALQVCSIVACSFYLAAFLGLVIFLLVLLMHPEALNRKDGMKYSSPGVIANMAATSAAFFFTAAGTIHMTTLHGLIHYNDTSTDDQSTICNPAYSHCYIGPGGSWAVFAIVSAFVCGFVLLLAGYYSRCKRGGASDWLILCILVCDNVNRNNSQKTRIELFPFCREWSGGLSLIVSYHHLLSRGILCDLLCSDAGTSSSSVPVHSSYLLTLQISMIPQKTPSLVQFSSVSVLASVSESPIVITSSSELSL